MSNLKPLNDQPVVLTLSFESVLKLTDCLETVKRSVDKVADFHHKDALNPTNEHYYTNLLQAKNLKDEFNYLNDLQRTLSMMLDNVADKYADKVAQQDKEMQAAMRATPSPIAEAVPVDEAGNTLIID